MRTKDIEKMLDLLGTFSETQDDDRVRDAIGLVRSTAMDELDRREEAPKSS